MRQIYESLVAFDDKQEIVPMLAERWEQLPGSMGYKFYLKKGVTFHNGEEMKASDVLFTFTRATGVKGAAVHSFSSYIDPAGIKVVDDYTIIIPTRQPMGASFLASMNHPWSSILNQKAVEKAGLDYGMNPVGTGRFKLVSWAKGDRLSFERFEGYHGKKAPLSKMIIRAVVEAPSRTIELESGAVDVANEIPYVDISRVSSSKNAKMEIRPGQVVFILGMDITRPPYDNLKLRQAMNIAINRAGIVKAVFKGYAEAATGVISSSVKYSKTKVTPVPALDIAKARQLLQEAGYPNGFKGTLMVPDRTEYLNPMTVLQENLRAIGMEMEIKVYEWGAYQDAIRQPGHAPFITASWGGAPALDPFFFMTPQFHSSAVGQTNRTFMKDKEIDALLDKGAALSDGPEREAVYHELWDRLNAILPWICVVSPNRTFGVSKELRGVNFGPSSITYYGTADFAK